DIPRIERQLEYADIIDDLSDAGVSSFHQRCIRLDFDSFGDLADLKGDINYWIAAHLKYESGSRECPESRKHGLQAIRADWQILKDVKAGFIRHNVSRQAGCRLRRRHLDSREHRAGLIPYGAGN